MSALDQRTLGSILTEPILAPIAPHAIENMDLTKEAWWPKTISQLRQQGFGGDLKRGLCRILRAAESGDWFYPLYQQADADKAGCNLVWFPSDDPKADERPYVLLIPGGGFWNVWSLTEGWPVADHFNCAGFHAFVLTYRVGGVEGMLDKEMEDVAAAVSLIREKAGHFHVNGDRYITCGFSAGGYITCLWSTMGKGYGAFGLPRPEAMIPIYPVTSFKQLMADHAVGGDLAERLFYTDIAEAVNEDYEIPEHVEGFPPCCIFLAAGDELVPPVHSKLLKAALDEKGIPCHMEIGPTGGHGFADGTGMCMEGWPERAAQWFLQL